VFAAGDVPNPLPTTIMHYLKRLGLWHLAVPILERLDPDRGEIEDHSTSTTWRLLGFMLSMSATRDELRNQLEQQLARYATKSVRPPTSTLGP
jgi:hypothetical protein